MKKILYWTYIIFMLYNCNSASKYEKEMNTKFLGWVFQKKNGIYLIDQNKKEYWLIGKLDIKDLGKKIEVIGQLKELKYTLNKKNKIDLQTFVLDDKRSEISYPIIIVKSYKIYEEDKN